MRRGALIGGSISGGFAALAMAAFAICVLNDWSNKIGFQDVVAIMIFALAGGYFGIWPGAFIGLAIAWGFDRSNYGPVEQWSILGTSVGFGTGLLFGIACYNFGFLDDKNSFGVVTPGFTFLGFVAGAFFGSARRKKQKHSTGKS